MPVVQPQCACPPGYSQVGGWNAPSGNWNNATPAASTEVLNKDEEKPDSGKEEAEVQEKKVLSETNAPVMKLAKKLENMSKKDLSSLCAIDALKSSELCSNDDESTDSDNRP